MKFEYLHAMKITSRALRDLVRESLDKNRILKERPWSVEYTFKMSGGTAEDSEGQGPDGFFVTLKGESGKEVRVVVDAYWNPQSGDQSGNSLRIESDDTEEMSSYVPHRFDDGKEQRLIISNSPVSGIIAVSLAAAESPPVTYLVFPNPFDEDEDVDFNPDNLGNGTVDVKLKSYVNM